MNPPEPLEQSDVLNQWALRASSRGFARHHADAVQLRTAFALTAEDAALTVLGNPAYTPNARAIRTPIGKIL